MREWFRPVDGQIAELRHSSIFQAPFRRKTRSTPGAHHITSQTKTIIAASPKAKVAWLVLQINQSAGITSKL
jgi:hypothetical protein